MNIHNNIIFIFILISCTNYNHYEAAVYNNESDSIILNIANDVSERPPESDT